MRILELLFENKIDNEYIITRAFNSSGKPTTKSSKDINKLSDFITKHRLTHDLYYSVCSSSTTKLDAKSIKTAYAVWCDIDYVDDPVKLTEELSFALPPSVTVSSGNGLHCYWILDTPSTDLDRVEEANKMIIDLLGGDSGTWNRSRILRVDDTFNLKDQDNRKAVQIIRELPVKYSLSDIEAACELTDNIVLKICTGDRRGYGSRSERDYGVITQCIIERMSDNAIDAIFQYQAIGDRYRERNQGSRYLGKSIANAREATSIEEVKEETGKKKKKKLVVNGIIEQGNCYWLKFKGQKKKLSTFALHPLQILSSINKDAPDVIRCEVVTEKSDHVEVVDLPKDVFTGIRAITKLLTNAHWQWIGTDADLRKVLPYIIAQVTSDMYKTYSTQLGKVNGLWLGTNQVLTSDGKILDYADSDTIFLGRKGFNVHTGFNGVKLTKKRLLETLDAILSINDISIIGPILGWSVASLLKTELYKLGHRSPFLNVYGTKGSGKTTTIQQVIQPLTGYLSTSSIDCNTTLFSLLSILSSSTEVPIYLSEYRAQLNKAGGHLQRLLLLLYDRAEDYRGNADQSMTAYPLTSPIVLDGNDPVNDPALLERTIQLRFSKASLRRQEFQDRMADLQDFDLTAFSTHLITHVLGVTTRDLKRYYKSALALFEKTFKHLQIDIRVKHNHSIVLLGLMLLYDFVGKKQLPDVKRLFENSLENITSSSGNTVMQFDMFVEDLLTAIADTTVYTSTSNPIFKEELEKGVVWIHLKTCLNWWIKHRNNLGLDTLDTRAIKAQARERIGDDEDNYILSAQTISIERKSWHCLGIDLSKARLLMELPE